MSRGIDAFLVAALCVLGCQTQDLHAPLQPGTGSIVGRVLGPVGGLPGITVVAESVGDEDDLLKAWAVTDDDGSFTLPVIEARYVVYAENLGGHGLRLPYGANLHARDATPDTLRVDALAGPTRIEFRFGGIDVLLHETELPDDVEWEVTAVRVPHGGDFELERDVQASGLRFASHTVQFGKWMIHVEASDDSWRSEFYLGGSLDASEGDVFAVSPGDLTAIEAVIPAPALVHGQLVGAAEWPDLSMAIRVIDGASDHVGTGRPDAAGRFEIPVFGEGSARVTAQGFLDGPLALWVGGNGGESATHFALRPGTQVDVGRVEMAFIRVTLDDPDQLGDRARVELYEDVEQARLGLQYLVRRPELGDEFERSTFLVSPGTFYLAIRHTSLEPWRPQWFDRRTPSAATPIETRASEVTDVQVVLERGGVLEGLVRGSDGQPMTEEQAPSMTVQAFTLDGDQRLGAFRVFVAADGTFRLPGLPDGSYRLAASAPWLPGRWYPGSDSREDAEVVTIVDASVVSGLEIQF